MKKLAILGTRGIPACHGGFETFAERLALYLVTVGWSVTVYCPTTDSSICYEDMWCGIRLLYMPVKREDAAGTIMFDWDCTKHVARENTIVLNLGYGTAIFGLWLKMCNIPNLINMDGIEWRREKWAFPARMWLYVNERIACLTASHLVADHPEIKRHLATRTAPERITMIPYGADAVSAPSDSMLAVYGLEPGSYFLVIARPDPDNSILEIVQAFCARPRQRKLVILGKYMPESQEYHHAVMAAANDYVIFPGGIYEQATVEALRYYCRLYIHGHRVGGTNPSLVEALAAGSPILAHDNLYNRWVAGENAAYFSNAGELESRMEELDNDRVLSEMAVLHRERHRQQFTWEQVLSEYDRLLTQYVHNS